MRERIASGRERVPTTMRERIASGRERIAATRERVPTGRERVLTSRERVPDSERGPTVLRRAGGMAFDSGNFDQSLRHSRSSPLTTAFMQ
jgi:hypothetical protein